MRSKGKNPFTSNTKKKDEVAKPRLRFTDVQKKKMMMLIRQKKNTDETYTLSTNYLCHKEERFESSPLCKYLDGTGHKYHT